MVSDTDKAIETALQKQESTLNKMLQIQRESFQSALTAFAESTNHRIDTFIKEMTEKITVVKFSLEYTQGDVDNNKYELRKQGKETCKIEPVEECLKKIDEQVDYLENQSRRNNLRIDGIPEVGSNETWE